MTIKHIFGLVDKNNDTCLYYWRGETLVEKFDLGNKNCDKLDILSSEKIGGVILQAVCTEHGIVRPIIMRVSLSDIKMAYFTVRIKDIYPISETIRFYAMFDAATSIGVTAYATNTQIVYHGIVNISEEWFLNDSVPKIQEIEVLKAFESNL